jgi:hypothetical protein
MERYDQQKIIVLGLNQQDSNPSRLAAKVELTPGPTLGIELRANGLEPIYVEA